MTEAGNIPSDVKGAPFELKVTFSGLAAFAHFDSGEMMALLPEARSKFGSPMTHLDGTAAEPHVGYMRFDLQHLGLPANSGEAIVKLDREEVTFHGLPTGRVADSSLTLPDFRVFAPVLQLDAGLRAAIPPDTLLARVCLSGGKLTGSADGSERTVSRVLTSDRSHGHQQVSDAFASQVFYTANIDVEKTLTIELKSFTAGSRRFTLAPVNGRVDISIANLCAENTLMWDDLRSGRPASPDDLDFKWFCRLFVPKPGEAAPPYTHERQVPYITKAADRRQGLESGCIQARGGF